MASPAPTSNPTQPATTAEHDPDFAKFDEYPWARDRAFLVSYPRKTPPSPFLQD